MHSSGGAGQSGRRQQPRWGSLPARRGIVLLVGSTAVGAIGTIVFGSGPGALLGIFLVAGSIAAAFAVDLRRAYLIIPFPALAYLIAALIAGLIHDRQADLSHTALAVSAAQWLAAGFLYLAVATVAVIAAGIGRWVARWRRTYGPRSGTAK